MVIDEVCDVADLDAVRAWTDDLSGRIDALHGLVHNAGVMPKERAETPQGHETQLACHVLGPHLMTERLLPLLRNADGSSVVFMSSGGMYTAPLDADDMESAAGEYDGHPGLRADQADAGGARRRVGRATGRRATSASRACIPVGRRLPVSPRRCRRSRSSPGRCCATPPTARTPRCGWSRPGPISAAAALLARPGAAADDLRLAAPQDPTAVARFLDEVSAMTDTTRNWVRSARLNTMR